MDEYEGRASQIVQTAATGEEVSKIILKLEDALEGQTRGPALIALLTLILVMQHPDITPDQLRDGVKDVSQFICMWLDCAYDMPTEALSKAELN